VSVDLDHTDSLGPTIESIAAEKAGIVKPGKPLISGVVQQPALGVLRRVCRDRGAALIDARTAVRLEATGGALRLRTAAREYPDLRLNLAGRHQIDNARVALCAFEALAAQAGYEPRAEAVREGLATVRWAGRLQWIERPGEPPLLLDGAHNPAGARTLARHLEGLRREPPVLLFGTMRDKPAAEILEHVGPLVHAAVLTRPPVTRAADPADLVVVARRTIPAVEIREDPGAGLARAREIAGRDRFVLVTGSLYLVGAVLAWLGDRAAPGPVPL
jgi:dihydrofolate synthase/folylpolyglutamate synthase